MRTNFTLLSNKLFTSAFLLASLVGITSVKAQAPFAAGQTYYVNGIGNDLVAPKDTFANLTGAYVAGNPYTASTGVISALNANGINPNTIGQITILLVAGYNGQEANAQGVNVGTISYASALRTIVMKPAPGSNFNITTSVNQAANTGLFSLSGTQFFILDGEGTPGQRNITFTVRTVGANATQRAVEMISTTASPINNVTVKNININGVTTTTAVSTFAGVYIGGSNINTNSARRNSNIAITNCNIQGVQYGVYARGVGSDLAGNQDLGLIVRNNKIGGEALIGGAVNASGIMLSNQANAVVEGNTISGNLQTTPGFKGIELSNIASVASLDTNILINANRIYNIASSSAGITGIRVALGNHTNPLAIKITNNTIAKISSPGAPSVPSLQYPIGILIENGSANAGIDIFNNSVALTGAILNGAPSACLATGTTLTGGLRMYNNIFSNTQQHINNTVGAYNTYAIIVNKTPTSATVVTSPFDSCDNNLYEVTTTGGWANVAYTILNNYTSVAEWATYTGYEKRSIYSRPFFENDSTLVTSNGAATKYGNLGRTMVAADNIGNTRPATNSSIGAYQFTQNTTNAYAPLLGSATYLINGVDAWPTNASPTTGSFATLTSFINHLNSFGTSGSGTISVTFVSGFLTDATIPPAILPYPGMSVVRPIKLTASVPVNITIPNGTAINNNSALIKFYGASFFEIDGTNNAGGFNITISLPATATSSQAKLIALIPTLSHTTSNITIRNCMLSGSSSTASNNTLAAIYMGASNNATGLASAIGGANLNNFIGNNTIESVRYGIYWRAKADQTDQFLTIYKNIIGGTRPVGTPLPTTYIGGITANAAAIYVKGVLQGTIDSNIIRNSIPNTTGYRGIDIDGTPNEGGSAKSIAITRNTIYNLGATSGYAVGIRVGLSEANSGITIHNNIIAKIYGTGSGSTVSLNSPAGIAFESPVVASGVVAIGVSMLHNTINLSQHPTVQVNSGAFSTALFIDARASGIACRNNLFSNTLGRTVAGTVSNAYVLTVGGTQNPFSESNANVYYSGANSNFTNNQIGFVNPNVQLPSLFELRSLYGFETTTKFGEVPFLNDSTSAIDTMYVGHIAKSAVRTGTVVVDIAGKPRDFAATIGAVELPRRYSPLIGGATYQVNGVLAPPLDGSGTVGSFNTINNLFRYINTNGVDADQPPFYQVVVNITSGYVGEGDTLISTLHDYPMMSSNRLIVIKPAAGANPTISSTGATTNSQFSAAASVLRFQGARWVTIDGSNDGITKNLTIRLPQTPANVSYVNNQLTRVIDVMGWAQPATNITIKNCNILGYSTPNTISTYAGIYQGGVAFNSATTVPINPIREKNNNNTYQNNFIGAVKYGIHLRGNISAAGSYDIGTTVKGNIIGGGSFASGVPTDYFGGINNAAGILATSQAKLLIDSNVISNNISSFNLNSGIEISSAVLPFFNTDSAVTITRNTITNIRTTSTVAYGINVNLRWDNKKSLNIYNNMISGIAGQGAVPSGANFNNNPYGILLNGTQVSPQVTEIDVNIWNNSINLGQGTSLGAAGISACIGIYTTTIGDITITNNILQNRLSRSVAGGNIYAIAASGNINPLKATDYNNYYVAGTIGNNQIAGVNLSNVAVNFPTLAAWADYTKQDTLSMSVLTPFTSDVNLLIPASTASPLFRAGQRISIINTDILGAPRPSAASGVATIGAHEFLGSYQDIFGPKIYDMTLPSDFCYFDGIPFEIKSRVMDKSPVVNDTMYYRLNGGNEIALLATTRVGLDRVYAIPAQPMNTRIAYRFGGVDGGNQKAIFVNTDPKTGYNYTTTVIAIDPTTSIATGFDNPNEFNWKAQAINTDNSVIWDIESYGSVTNPVLAPLTGTRAAMLPTGNNVASRLYSTCLDFVNAKRPTLRLYVSQSSDNMNVNDSLVVKVSPGFGLWTDPNTVYPVYRKNGEFAVPGYKVYDFCLEDFTGYTGLRLGIEGYSKNGGNMIIDSIVIFDNFLSLPVTPKNFTNCYNDSINLTIANADSKFEYTVYDMLTDRFIGKTQKGTDANMVVQGYLASADSAYLRIWARNLTSNCANFMNDTAIVRFKNFKNGPFVVKGSVFNGQYNAGDGFTPDAVKVGGEARYQIVAPKGTTNASYNTDWTVSNVSIYKFFYDQTSNQDVVIDSARNYNLIPPAGGNPGYVSVIGMPADSNKTFVMAVTVRLLPNGCDSVVYRTITIANAPIANFYAPNDTLCQNINNQFTNVSTTGVFTIPMQYSWDFGDGTTSNAASPIKSFANPGTYRVRMIVKNNTTLLDSMAYNIVVLPSPIAEFTSTLACEGKVTRFTSTGPNTAGNIYSFNIGGQVADSSVVDAIVPGAGSTVNVRLTVKNIQGCTDTAVNAVQVFHQPHASFTAQNVCAGAPVQFNNTSTITPGVNGRVNSFGSEWSFGNGDIGYSNSPLYFYPAGGTYKAVLKLISNYGCVDTVSTTVSVFNKPAARFTLDNTCKGSNLIIENNSTFADGINNVRFRWNFGDNSAPTTNKVPVHAFGATGTYLVKLVATDTLNNCVDSIQTIASVKNTAEADFTVSNGCVGKPVTFTNQSIVPPSVTPTFTYIFGDNTTSNTPNTTHSYITGGTKQAKLIVDVEGCRDTASKTIEISSAVSINWTKIYNDFNSVTFTANRTGLARYSWNFNDGTPIVNTSNNVITHIFDQKGIIDVTLTVLDENSCDALYTDTVKIDRRVGLNEDLATKVNLNVYPNPFTTTSNVVFDLDKSETVKIEVYDMIGRNVYTQDATTLASGKHTIELNESDFNAKSAVYMVRLHIGNSVITKQLIKN
ncbi:MAG: PKD domain-containing protein [Bacteroidia bacterium]|nr:PKD domain-containing protein [Bacteroidia bacterium]